jgi:hypothetical protein
MSINLKKEAEFKLIDLKKKANIAVEKSGLAHLRAKVALVLDYSGSMRPLFKNGTVQRNAERLLALASKFDDDGCIEVFIFHHEAYKIGSLCESNFFDYINNEIYSNKQYKFGRTEYACGMDKVLHHYFPNRLTTQNIILTKSKEPIFVIFITDGNNSDKNKTTKLIKEASQLPVFWQFIGIGDEKFEYLQKLDNLTGRLIDNANFFEIKELEKIPDEDLYSKLLAEFPGWFNQAKSIGVIRK